MERKTSRTKRIILIWELRRERPREIMRRLKEDGCMPKCESQFWRDLRAVRNVEKVESK
jgi:hypothetical protein